MLPLVLDGAVLLPVQGEHTPLLLRVNIAGCESGSVCKVSIAIRSILECGIIGHNASSLVV